MLSLSLHSKLHKAIYCPLQQYDEHSDQNCNSESKMLLNNISRQHTSTLHEHRIIPVEYHRGTSINETFWKMESSKETG